ncbi:MAG: prolyl oligopeptidase family serine peptidase, partial [Mycobacteriales bacterium]
MRVRTALAAGAALTGLVTSSALAAGGLPSAPTGHRPGPDALYQAPPRAPQLENTGVWKADPVLVAGGASYRQGEWVYQDFLLDDHGATGVKDPNDENGPSAHLFSPAGGTFTYPTDPVYAGNAADLVELRVRPLRDATAFRVTLNTLKDPSRTAFTLALGSSTRNVAWPHGAGVSSPSALFVTVHGSTADLLDADGKALTPAPRASVDLLRRQVTVLVPHAAWDPGSSTVRTTVGVGLWGAGAYLKPAPGPATATTPGGGGPLGVAIVNVGPRLQEPLPIVRGGGYTIADTAALGTVQAAWWRERQQSLILAQGVVTPFAADVDFGKMLRHVRDDSAVPQTGSIERIFASHRSFGQGVDASRVCFDLASSFAAGAKCVGRDVGQLQQYVLYVPRTPVPARGRSLTLLLHSLSANENQYAGSRNQSQLGDRGDGSLVLTPAGRGPDGFYAGVAETDTFEAWADVARHYRLDADRTVVTGYSMGGFGTYRMLARWPDLFARGFSVVGAPGSVGDQLVSLRNTPLLAWNSGADELVDIRTSEAAVTALTAAGVRFQENLHPTADHLTLAANDEYGPGAAFLLADRVDRDPA